MAIVNAEDFSTTKTPSGTTGSSWLSLVGQAVSGAVSPETAKTDGLLGQAMDGNEVPLYNYQNEAKAGITFEDLINSYNNGEMTASELFQKIALTGIKTTPYQQDLMNHILDKEAKGEQYDREIQYIIDSINATQQAAANAGLNSSAYLMSQGAGSGVGAGKGNVDGLVASQQAARDRFNAKASAAKTLLGLIGAMGTAGIHGASIYAARNAVAKLTTEASLASRRMGTYHVHSDGTMTKDIYEY